MKGGLIRAHQPRNKRISCEGQRGRQLEKALFAPALATCVHSESVSPDDEYTQPDGSCMSESHCTVVKMVGVQEPLLRYPRSIAKSSCASRSLGEVASSSGVQQVREQKCSAGRQLGGGDDDFDY